jgi:glucuronosyltransferase
MGLQFILAVALLFANTPVLFSKNILAVMPLTARSHFKSFQPLFEEIVKRGHNLTIISGYQLREDLRSNYTHINMKHHFHHLLIKFSEMRHQNRLENLIFSINRLHDYTEHLLQKPEFQMVIKSNDSYDMVITEIFFIDVYFSLGYRFNAPTIGLSAQNLISYYSWVIGNPCPSSHIPNIFLPLTETMSYVHRVINTAYNLITGNYRIFLNLKKART